MVRSQLHAQHSLVKTKKQKKKKKRKAQLRKIQLSVEIECYVLIIDVCRII